MSRTLFFPKFIPLDDFLKEEDKSLFSGDDVVYSPLGGHDILRWSFLDDYLVDRQLTTDMIRIDMARTANKERPLDYWQHIIAAMPGYAVYVIIRLAANSTEEIGRAHV